MKTAVFCPYCGSEDLAYFDDEYRGYAHCRSCDENFGVGSYNQDEIWQIRYMIQKFKVARRQMENFHKMMELKKVQE